jgi:hypothetical protein
MLQKAAIVATVIFLLIGILGFIPGIAGKDSMGMPLLFGLFMVGTVHNIIHLASGVLALASATNERWARLYFQVFGVIYAVVTVAGFVVGSGDSIFGLFHVNTADNFLHLVLAVAGLAIGFAVPGRTEKAQATT